MDRDREFMLRSMSCKSVDDIKRICVDVIENAISDLKKSHGLTLCQLWMLHTVKNENDQSVCKYGGCYKPAFNDYYKACVKIEDGLGGVAVKALETYKSYLSRNIMKGELQALIPATSASESSNFCLGICLRNIETGNYDYAFEFYFSSYEYNNNNNDPCVFLESLFLKLESCLPGFEFSSGLQLGRQLVVMDVDNPTESFNILASRKQEKEEDCEGRLLKRLIKVSFVNSLNRAEVEIKEALSFLTESHGLTLCQIWTNPYIYSNDNTKLAMKMDGYCDPAFKDYYDACVKIENGAGGLALKTRIAGKPYFSRNINNIVKGRLHALLPATSSSPCCCFAMCLRNIYTGGVDYAFELLFSLHDQDPYVFLDSLLVKLETCFPNFKLSSGARLGRQLQVLDGDNLAVNFNITAFLKQQDTETPSATNDIMSFLSMNLGVVTKKVMDVSASVKFADLKTKISEKFHLVSGAYRLSYIDVGSTGRFWRQLQDDRDLNKCIRLAKRITKPRFLIRVLPCTILNEGGGIDTRVPKSKRRHKRRRCTQTQTHDG